METTNFNINLDQKFQNNCRVSETALNYSCFFHRYSISDLPSVIDRELNERGLTENRFAVIGFGGPDDLAKPHVFTSGSKIFSDGIKTSQSINK